MNAKRLIRRTATTLASACLLAAMPMVHAQMELPDSIKVPQGNKVALETLGVGEVTYECRAKVDNAGEAEWVFAGPDAVLNDRSGKQVGTYFGPPATWKAIDGSSITGAQLAVAPAGAGNLPYQLVKANPADGEGAMSGISYIQRVAIQGGVAPASGCSAATKGQRETVKYQADYIFWVAG
ncbi:DUF3455 domain-containing protein [Pseudomonas sp. SA3-5]|uniref:DUF3455 domain-containing protein n=1 Tax=Pseudomonas aestuarii TaxID=3018340 RepID=A0ABT4XG01_9PSED|nr:DUF3455 domain-containing protein [Pseudomonas aestuarii]MDA7087127.1 DUF3455 domain-containing protein [Pseudomonas aestuarii]